MVCIGIEEQPEDPAAGVTEVTAPGKVYGMARQISARAKGEEVSTMPEAEPVVRVSKTPLPLKRDLPEDERALLDLFSEFDIDGDGCVNCAELQKYLQTTPWASKWAQREGFTWDEVSMRT